MALTLASDLKYESMKAALKRIFISTPISGKDSGDIEVKQESVFYTKPGGPRQKVKLNPINKQGQVSRCAICNSKIHWAKQCPHHLKNSESSFITEDNDNDKQYEDVQIILMTGQAIKNEIFLTEMVSSAVIDTSCSRTVAGKQWFHNYLKRLDDNSLNNLRLYHQKLHSNLEIVPNYILK